MRKGGDLGRRKRHLWHRGSSLATARFPAEIAGERHWHGHSPIPRLGLARPQWRYRRQSAHGLGQRRFHRTDGSANSVEPRTRMRKYALEFRSRLRATSWPYPRWPTRADAPSLRVDAWLIRLRSQRGSPRPQLVYGAPAIVARPDRTLRAVTVGRRLIVRHSHCAAPLLPARAVQLNPAATPQRRRSARRD